jgi:hypothetical protein
VFAGGDDVGRAVAFSLSLVFGALLGLTACGSDPSSENDGGVASDGAVDAASVDGGVDPTDLTALDDGSLGQDTLREPPSTEEECTAAGGRWIQTMKGDRYYCVLPTSDGGEPCTDSDQCESWCEAPADAQSGDQVTGTCSEWQGGASCVREVVDGKAQPQVCA